MPIPIAVIEPVTPVSAFLESWGFIFFMLAVGCSYVFTSEISITL
jgi:hypothetical protein